MPICGPKLSICCSLLSVWGIVMLVSVLQNVLVHKYTGVSEIHKYNR